MGLFEHFPYTNFHDLNLDKILERTKEAEIAVKASAADAAQAAADAAAIHGEATQALNTANAASAAAANAVNTANAANTAAGNAVNTANAANTAAGNAVNTAGNAVNTANAANTAAGNAVSTANAANTAAGNAVNTANTASNNATNAVNTANAAAADAAAALAANLQAFPVIARYEIDVTDGTVTFVSVTGADSESEMVADYLFHDQPVLFRFTYSDLSGTYIQGVYTKKINLAGSKFRLLTNILNYDQMGTIMANDLITLDYGFYPSGWSLDAGNWTQEQLSISAHIAP